MYDQFGRELGVGDIIMLPQQSPTLWQIQDVKADLRPEAPAANFHLISLAAVDSIGGPGGKVLAGVIKIRDASEYLPPAIVTPEGDGEGVMAAGPTLVSES